MKLDDILTESQIDELGIAKKIGGGIRGAVTGFKSSMDKRAGKQHSERIVNNLRKEFMKQVGGGAEASMQNLLDFLNGQGLDTSSVSMPAQEPEIDKDQPKQRIEPTLNLEPNPEPEKPKTTAPTTSSTGGTVTPTATGLQHKASPDNPNQPKPAAPQGPGAGAFSSMASQLGAPTGNEPPTATKPKRTGGKVPGVVSQTPNAQRKRAARLAKSGGVVKEDTQLNAVTIDKIIRDVVQKNYAKIRQAQAGTLPAQTLDLRSQPQAEPQVPSNNAFSNPEELEKSWDEYVKAGGTITDQHKKLFAKLSSSQTAPATASTATTTAPTTESVYFSKFLGQAI